MVSVPLVAVWPVVGSVVGAPVVVVALVVVPVPIAVVPVPIAVVPVPIAVVPGPLSASPVSPPSLAQASGRLPRESRKARPR